MNISFSGKVAVVTGGAMGIGEATARTLASLGANVFVLDVNAEVAEKTRASIRDAGGRCEFVECDVSLAAQVEASIAKIVQKSGGIDVLVSNAGIQVYGDVVDTTEAVWDQVMAVNLKGCFLASKFVVPEMLKRGGGSIVVIGSVQSLAANANSAAYVTSKHALLGLVRSMSLDYASKNIRVNCVCPGTVDTPMLRWAASLDSDPAKVIDTCKRMHPVGRIGKPEEVAQAIAFLASDCASFVTGAALVVDGGMLVPAGGMGFQQGGTGSAKS